MTAAPGSPDERDRNIAITRRIRTGLLSAGVVGSLGFAGLTAYSTVHASADRVASPSEQSQAGSAATGFDDEHGGERGDDGSRSFESQAPRLQQGSGGSSHGSTSGS